MTFLKMSGITAGYGNVPILFDVDIETHEGETVALLGANGAGKTTLLKVLSGIVPLRSGEIELLGERIERWGADKRVAHGLAHVPGGASIFPTLTVEENLRMGAHVFRRNQRKVSESIEAGYALFPRLKDRRNQPAETLSGGEQQMLAIARGLATGPKLLAVDEASFGLAPQIADQVFDIIREIKTRGISILLVEQNVPRSLDVADRVYGLESGRVAFSGDPREASQHLEIAELYLGGDVSKPKRNGGRSKSKAKTRRTTNKAKEAR